MKYIWLIYLQFLFVIGQFNGKKNWIDKHILLCYNKLDKLEVNYIKYHNFDCKNNNDNYNLPIVFKHVLNRILTETIELDCQEKRCSFNKERGNDEKTK